MNHIDDFNFLGDDMSPEEAKKLDDLLFQSFEEEIEYYTKKGEQMGDVEFSHEYEAKLQSTLEQYLGKDEADELMYQRALRDGKAAEPADSTDAVKISWKDRFAGFMRMRWTRPAFAAVCVLVLCTTGIFATKSDALKIPIGRFFEEDEADYIVLNAETDTEEYPTTIEKQFVPEKVLDGYEEVARDEQLMTVTYVYQNSEGLLYQFTQETKDMSTWTDNENVNYVKYDTIFGDAYYYEKNNVHKLVWHFEDYVFKIEGNLTKDEMIEIANTLRLKE